VAITIPLPALALKYLKELYIRANGSEYLFPNRRAHKVKQRFLHMSPDTINTALKKLFTQDKMPVEHFTIHDLRRTCRSLLASLKVPDHIAERCMNHKLKGVSGTYNRYDYLDERREALDKLALLLESIIDVGLTIKSF
jgi:integrase